MPAHACGMCSYVGPRMVSLFQHRNAMHIAVECCGGWVKDQGEFNDHRINQHNYCVPCEKFFPTPSALRQHDLSPKHRVRQFDCRYCNNAYISQGALVLHYESGTCASGISRRDVDYCVALEDRDGTITDLDVSSPGRHSRYYRQDHEDEDIARLPVHAVIDDDWDGSCWYCPWCPMTFGYKAQLHQHLNSPKHAHHSDKLYICPGRECDARQCTLSGLVQHFESAECGAWYEDGMRKTVNGFVRAVGRFK